MTAKQSNRVERVPIAQGVRVPRSFDWIAAGEDGGPELRLGLEVVDARVVCTRLELHGDLEHLITSTLLRLIRLDDLVTMASLQNASVTLSAGDTARAMSSGELPSNVVEAAGRATRRRPADLALSDVAQLYEAAGGGGDAMREIKAVATCSEATAWRLIRRARDSGLIPVEPLRRGPKPQRGN